MPYSHKNPPHNILFSIAFLIVGLLNPNLISISSNVLKIISFLVIGSIRLIGPKEFAALTIRVVEPLNFNNNYSGQSA